ncbi:hypothetical protein GH153_00150 [bacterium]|nr:hypothetical protein [bacterium]
MKNKAERLKSAKRYKKKFLNRLHDLEKKTQAFYDPIYFALKTKKEKNEYLINKWKLKKHFEFIDEIAESPEKLREKIEKVKK